MANPEHEFLEKWARNLLTGGDPEGRARGHDFKTMYAPTPDGCREAVFQALIAAYECGKKSQSTAPA